MSASWLRITGLVVVSACLAAGCSEAKKIDVGGACILNSDCNSPLVCTAGKCHDACHTSADCPVGQSCIIASDQSTVCQLPVETHCAYNSECQTPLICAADLQCRNQCQGDVDCSPGQICTTTKTCAEPNQVDSNNNLFPPDGGVSSSGGASGADGPGSCPMGAEGCSCYPNDTCNAGLTCASHLCVSMGAGGSSGGGDGGVRDARGAQPDVSTGGAGGGATMVDSATGSGGVDAGGVVPTDGLVAYFPFNGNNKDESGNGNDLSQSTASLVSDRFGRAERAFRFAAASDMMLSQKFLGITGNQPRTISIWLRVISIVPGAHFIAIGAKDAVTENASFGLAAGSVAITGSDNTLLLWACGYSSDWRISGVQQHAGMWEHHVLKYDGSTAYWYVNGGRLTSTFPHNYQTTDGTISVGMLPIASGVAANADIDDIRIYSRALTDGEVGLLYNEGPD